VTRVLVVGLPRSGTTWIASMLAQAEDAVLVMEPDNQFTVPFALRAKRGLPGGFYTALAPADQAPAYEALWRQAFGERGTGYSRVERLRRAAAQRVFDRAGEEAARESFTRARGVSPWLRAAERLAVPERPAALAEATVAKSVYATQAVEWLAARLDVQVVVVLRDLRNLLSSWVALGWVEADELAASDPALLARRRGVPPVPAGGSRLARLTWLLALLARALDETARAHPEWHVARHEEVAARPAERFRELAGGLGLRWGAAADEALAASDRPGSGYAIEREASSLPEVWRTRLDDDQVEEITSVLAAFSH
jgi:Sulfotransferase family